MEIYADVIFFVNFIFSYVLLYILGKFVNTVKIKKLRLAVAAVIGGISSAIIFCIEMPMWISYVLRCVAMFLMITTAYFEKRKNILNQMLWFVMLGGIMMFVMIMLVSLTGKTIGMAINNGIVYFDINSKVFAVSLGISCIMMIFFVKMFKNRKNKKYYILNVTHNDRTITVSALFDSGNLLKEPITGKYVSILEWEAAKELFISQPSLTKSIKELEKEMHVRIFDRTNKGIVVSKDGEEFLAYARQVLEQAELLEEKYMNKSARKQEFCVSTQHYSFAVNAFVDLIKEYGMKNMIFLYAKHRHMKSLKMWQV